MRIKLLLGALAVAASIFTVESPRAGGADVRAATAVHITPNEPAWDDVARLAELAARRARVAEFAGAKAIVVLFSGEPRVYAGDVDYEFRQENNFFYLTQLNQPGATLVLMPGAAKYREVLFLPRRNPAREVWTGHMYSPEEAYKLSGVGEIWDAAEFEPFMRQLRARRLYRPKEEVILLSQPAPAAPDATAAPQAAAAQEGGDALLRAMALGEASLFLIRTREEESSEFRREQNLAAEWAKSDRGLSIQNVLPIFVQMRQVKSPAELLLMQHAVDITTEALERAMSVAAGARWEYEVEAEVDYTFKRRHADNWGYPSIVGCGANATTLHYEESQGRVSPGDLLLMDVGAEYRHYSADVTRTFPVSGRFSPAQGEIYNAVYAASEAAMRASKPGATLAEVHNAALESIRDSLLRLGLVTDRNSSQYRLYFMHGTSHWLGMNVHDVGQGARRLEPGMVYTIEPGIYVRPDALDNLPKTPENQKFIDAVRPAFEKYKNVGVRIEDDVVITPEGYRNMTAALPRALQEVEALMARLAK
ncbi:MAG TPA: aminopeptidase P family protein [Pyrinomonadaceae bacterium]|nr:aminopeptidase P family protein [Pyrinomonadaceae bacterium]